VTWEPAAEAPSAERVALGVTYFGDALATVSGGVAPGWAYEGRLGLLLDANLGGLVTWQGARLHASLHQIQGQEPKRRVRAAVATTTRRGLAAIPSEPSVSAAPAIRL
jgi:carbohydrate-selective porin OprB